MTIDIGGTLGSGERVPPNVGSSAA